MFDLVSLIEFGGYIGLFLIIFAESGILIGFFLPGDSLLFTAGFLASQGFLNIWILIPLLFVAAVAGDAVGYWFGKKAGPRVFSREKSFFFHPSHVENTAAFFEKHGVKTIILARFVPVVRTFAPIMAGVGGMKYRTFAKYNIIGGLLWAVGLTTLGYLFGNFIPDADRYILPVILLIVITSLAPPAWQYFKERRQKSIDF
ncbi:MAG: VTT domain-containing protein [Candidatus Zambryskibacteria bacterium]|nr:VTT domain-containing protein [Candidatus Zambryskibacteria bacterium]